SSINFLLSLEGSCMSGEDLQVFLQAEGESLRANCSYDMHESLHEMKFWCKELSENSCPVLASSYPLTERMNLNHGLHRSVDLTDMGHGWISVIMRALRRNDSGTYQCGVQSNLQKILLQRIQMVVSAEEPVKLFAKTGNSLSLHCSYSVTDDIRKHQHFTWCKMVSSIKCQPIISSNSDQSIVKVGRTEMMNDFSGKMIRVWLKKLQFNDSGEYHLESRVEGRNKPLKRIVLEVCASLQASKARFFSMTESHQGWKYVVTSPVLVFFQGENWNLDADLEAIPFPTEKQGTAKPRDDSNMDQRNLYALMVLSSCLATTALAVTVILLATTYIRRKRAGKGTDFGRHPAFRQAVLQDRRNKTRKMPDGELKDNTVYAVIRHQPQLKPEDVIYVNTQPSPKVFFHLQEPPRNSVSSASVEYATIIFRPTTS
ncbi:PIGR protein, partial [Casuarius casuarius]|nr:PIGR protein [Casuarius casuarius]